LTSSLAHTTQATGDTARPFSDRHIGPRADDAQAMLAELGYDSLEALSNAAVPESIQNDELNLPAGAPNSTF
jgi:glycine dehydrogenase